MADHDGLMSMNDPDESPLSVTHYSSTSLIHQPIRNDTLISIQSSDQLEAGRTSEAYLDTLEKSLSAQSEDTLLQELKNDYSGFKSEPSLTFFHNVVSVSTFHIPSTRKICYPPGEAVASGETFSDCLEDLALVLREGVDTECVRTCVVSMRSGASLYPFRKMFLTTAKSHRRKQEAPIKAILHLIDQEWNLSPAVMESWGRLAAPTQGFPRIRRPSIFRERLTLDSPNEISRRLVWLAKAPEYKGRLQMYIFQPFTEPPEVFSAEIVIGGRGITSRDVLILLSLDCSSKRWSGDYDDPSLDWHSETATADTTWDIFRSIRVLCSYVIKNTEKFAQSMDERIEDMIYNGRQRPSRSRLQHLLCLEDSCRISLSGLQDVATLIEDLSDATESKFPGMEQDLREWFEKSKDDIHYLQRELKTAHQRILDVRAMIKDQLELQNDHRTNLLTLLAAIYIPFSFISSFFGMNLKDPLWSKKGSPNSAPGVVNGSTMANTLDSPSNNVSLFNTIETDAIINAITGSGTHLWSFKDYWIVTIPVVGATILLPIIVGPVFRYSIKNLLKNTAFIVPILMLLTMVASIATSLKDKFTAYTAVVLFPFGLTAVALLIYASVAGKDQILWCGYAITYGTSLWIDTFVRDFRIIDTPKGPWVSGLIPPTYLLITHFGISDWRNIGPRLKVFTWECIGMVQGAEKGFVRRAVPIVLYHIFAIPYWVKVRDRGTLLAIPFAILGANRLLNTFRDSNPKRFFVWLGFLAIWICSVAADTSLAPSRVSGFFIAFFPMWALVAYRAYLDHKTSIREALREKRRGKVNRGTEKPALGRSDSLPTGPRRQTLDTPRAPLSAHSRRPTADVSSVR